MLSENTARERAADIETLRFEAPIPYAEAYRFQIARRDAVENGEAGGALILLEHTPVYTLGRNARREHLLLSENALAQQGIDVCETDRGGDITYHGPGQLVAYPILDLNVWTPSVGWYLRTLEQVLIDVLSDYGLKGERVQGYTGVWVDGAKVAAIGVGIHNWVTYHGVALNIDPNMNHFANIVPCGIPDKPVTTLAKLLGKAPAIADVANTFEQRFRLSFEAREGRASARPFSTATDSPTRKLPAHGTFVSPSDPTIVFVTICTKDRKPWLANNEYHELLREVWKQADLWMVGHYVIMPDHVHFFASPTTNDVSLERWIRYWKSLFSKSAKAPEHTWQKSHWDRRLRAQESYERRWDYVRENPVRHGLVANAADWPFRGEMNELDW